MSKKQTIDTFFKLQNKLKKGTIGKSENSKRLELLEKIREMKCGTHKGDKGAVKVFKKVYGDEYIIAAVITKLAA